jgi:hypothetical protein
MYQLVFFFRFFCLALLSLGGFLNTWDFLATISIMGTFCFDGGFPLRLTLIELSTLLLPLTTSLQLEDATATEA